MALAQIRENKVDEERELKKVEESSLKNIKSTYVVCLVANSCLALL